MEFLAPEITLTLKPIASTIPVQLLKNGEEYVIGMHLATGNGPVVFLGIDSDNWLVRIDALEGVVERLFDLRQKLGVDTVEFWEIWGAAEEGSAIVGGDVPGPHLEDAWLPRHWKIFLADGRVQSLNTAGEELESIDPVDDRGATVMCVRIDVRKFRFSMQDATGRVTASKEITFHGERRDGESLDPFWVANSRAVFYVAEAVEEAEPSSLCAWFFDSDYAVPIARVLKHSSTSVVRAAFGYRTVLGKLERLSAYERFIYCGINVNDDSMEWIRIDTGTFQAQRVHLRVDPLELRQNFGFPLLANDSHMFIAANGLDMPGYLQILSAPLDVDADPLASRLRSDLCPLDFSGELRPVVFDLAGQQKLHFDRRILIARSEYFRDMLVNSRCQEAQTGEVDLREDPVAGRPVIAALLGFLLTDSFKADGDSDLAFNVRSLADRYRLPRLVWLAEAELLGLLSEDTVLAFLGRALDSRGLLESKCWELLEKNGSDILERQAECLDTIIQENPGFAKRLILHGARASKRQRTD
ncbi:unnamed protein product [Polarella glacialis]|uniref:BTB domain-containing protein n=1 Tax=Polarella glacialis TaxID=89957 RepID=A0A813FKB5_POLGL|nr:unnamed protein product [Polarella glacialis]